MLSEAKGLGNWQVSLDHLEWSSWNLLLVDVFSSSLVENVVDSTNSLIRALDLTEEDWLLESWLSAKLRGIHGLSSSRHDLASTSVNGISMKNNIVDVESDSSHVLLSHWSFSSYPLECRLDGVLDFVKVLNSLRDINKYVCADVVWSESPNLLSICLVPFKVFDKSSGSKLSLSLWPDLLSFDLVSKGVCEILAIEIQSVMLVRTL